MADGFHIYRRKTLPHWRMPSATYFVTWRLDRQQVPLTSDDRSFVMRAVLHFKGSRYDLVAFVVMDDHIHVIVLPLPPWTLEQVVRGWKSYTAHQLVQVGRKPPIWQREYFDRIVRDEDELCQKMIYISNNPYKRWPDLDSYEWVFPPE